LTELAPSPRFTNPVGGGAPGSEAGTLLVLQSGIQRSATVGGNSKWGISSAIYEKLATSGGSRSKEAKARLKLLRLEHFLWAD
jgi:hypothetical protein